MGFQRAGDPEADPGPLQAVPLEAAASNAAVEATAARNPQELEGV